MAKASELGSTQPKLPDPKTLSEELYKPHHTSSDGSVGPGYAKGLTDRLEKLEGKMQQFLSQATWEEKHVNHDSKNVTTVGAPLKQTPDLAPEPSSDGRLHNKPKFAENGFALPSSPGFGGFAGSSFASYRGASIEEERKPSRINGIDWQPANRGKVTYFEPTPIMKAPEACTSRPPKQPDPAALNRNVSLNKSRGEPSWSESFANTSALTSKTAIVPPPPKRNWPILTKGPDLEAPTSFSNTFKVPEVNDEDSEEETKVERKDDRISTFFRPNNPQVRSKDDEPNAAAGGRRHVEQGPRCGGWYDDLDLCTIKQKKEAEAQVLGSSKPRLTDDALRRLMYGLKEL